MNTGSFLTFVARFVFYTIVTACVIYTLTYAAGVISSPASTLQMIFGLILFVLTGSVVFNGIRWSIESFIDSRSNNETKENENA